MTNRATTKGKTFVRTTCIPKIKTTYSKESQETSVKASRSRKKLSKLKSGKQQFNILFKIIKEIISTKVNRIRVNVCLTKITNKIEQDYSDENQGYQKWRTEYEQQSLPKFVYIMVIQKMKQKILDHNLMFILLFVITLTSN